MNFKSTAGLALLVGAVLAVCEATAAPEYRSLLNVSGYTSYYTLANFPLLVRVSPARIGGFSYTDCAADGSDVSFVDENGAALSFELDTWDPKGESLFWVKIPSLDRTTRFYVRWKDADPPASTAASVWSDYVGVWHAGETSGPLADSTGHGLAAAPTGANAGTDCVWTNGVLGRARRNATTNASGNNSAFHLTPSYAPYDLTNNFSMSGWFRASDVIVNGQRLFSSQNTSTDNGVSLWLESASKMWGRNISSTARYFTGPAQDFQNEWVHVYYIVSGKDPSLYVNGTGWTRQASIPDMPANSTRGFAIGGNPNGNDRSFRGSFDECRLCKVKRNGTWAAVEYKQVAVSDFVTAGAAEALGRAAIRVTGTPYAYGDAGYGVHANCTQGTDYTYTAPASVDLGSGVTANLTGWKVYAADTRTLLRSSADAGEAVDSVTVTYSVPVEVEWQWSLSRIVDGDVTLYVSPAGHDDRDGLTVATALRTPQAAMDLAAGVAASKTTIVLCDGRYLPNMSASPRVVLKVNKSYVKVTSLNGKDTVILDGTTRTDMPTGESGGVIRPLTVAGSLTDVEICNLTLMNGARSASQNERSYPTLFYAGSGDLHDLTIHGYQRSRNDFIYLSGGAKLRNSTIDAPNAVYANNNSMSHNVVYMNGKSLLENCIIRDIKPATGGMGTSSATMKFQAVWMCHKDAVVRGCYICGMTNGNEKASTVAQGAGIYASAGTIENCTVTKCHALGSGGGIYLDGTVTLVNNIVYGNTATVSGNDIRPHANATITYSCSSDVTTDETTHNLNVDPLLKTDGTLAIKSPCAGKGNAALSWMTAESRDLAGNARIWTDGTVTMGAYEVQGRYSGLSGDFSVAGNRFGSVPYDATFNATVDNAEAFEWDFGDGSPMDTTSGKDAVHRYTVPGCYTVTLTARKAGVDPLVIAKPAYFTAVGPTCYVKEGCGEGISPYDTWEKATDNIMSALALKPACVCVTNGMYTYSETTGLYLDWPTRVVSVEGPDVTFIDAGYNRSPSGETDGKRFVTFANAQSEVEGFTFYRGLGLIMEGSGGVVRNCKLRKYQGVYRNAPIVVSSTCFEDCDFDFGGGYGLNDASAGERAHLVAIALSGAGLIDRCRIANLKFSYSTSYCSSIAGWGRCTAGVLLQGTSHMRNSLVTNCVFNVGNGLLRGGGVTLNGAVRLENCTIVGNSVKTNGVKATDGRAVAQEGGGVYVASSSARINNNVIWGNRRGESSGDVSFAAGVTPASFSNNLVSLAVDLPANAANCVTGKDPLLDAVSGYRITTASPCRNAGAKLDWCAKQGQAKDLDGQERRRNRPDIGCYEVQKDLGLLLLVR